MTDSQDTIQSQTLLPSQIREKLLDLFRFLVPDTNHYFHYGETKLYYSANQDYWFKSEDQSFMIRPMSFQNLITNIVFCEGATSHSSIWIFPEEEIIEFRNNEYWSYQDFVAANPLFDFLGMLEDLKTKPITID